MARPRPWPWSGKAAIVGSLLSVVVCTAEANARDHIPSHRYVTASWYGQAFKNRPTASGVRFDPNKMTGAHRSLPLGTHVRVTDMKGGRSVVVKIVDRGPYRKGRGIDLSYAAARRLGIIERGVVRVRVEPVPDPAKPPLLIAQAAPSTCPFPGAILQ
jgi:rare lipoprotein A